MGENLANQPCPFTSCGSSDAFSWYTPGSYGKCHSCNNSYPTKRDLTLFDWCYKVYPLKQEKESRVVEITSVTYNNIRGIDPEICRFYGIQLQLDKDDNPVRYAFKHAHGTKYREYDKKKFWWKDGSNFNDLFGPQFNAGTSKKIFLTEGEFDAASLFQVLGGLKVGYPCMSIPSSSIGDAFIKQTNSYLSTFNEIIYAGELDKAGQKAADRLYRAYPDKFYFVPMTKWKDANEFLTEGDGADLRWAALKPQRFTPDNFVVLGL